MSNHKADDLSLILPDKENVSFFERLNKRSFNYDFIFSGILKRVSDMKLNGSLDSEEPSTESESSSCRTRSSRSSKRHQYSGGSSYEENSVNGSPYEDESSASSVAGSDHCPPYEEIPVGSKRYSCSSLPSPPPSARESIPPFRYDSLFNSKKKKWKIDTACPKTENRKGRTKVFFNLHFCTRNTD